MNASSVLFLITVAAGAALSGCARPDVAAQKESYGAMRVDVVAVGEREVARVVAVPGEVRAGDRARLAAKVAGSVEDIFAKLGQDVRAGEVVARLSAPEYAAQVEGARTALAQAERELGRDRELKKGGVTTDDAVRTGEERVRAAKAALAEAEAMLGYLETRAPFDGRVAERPVNRGDVVMPGQALVVIDRSGAVEVLARVPAGQAGKLRVGETLTVIAEDGRGQATITEIAGAADAATRTVEVVLALAEGSAWRPGKFVSVEVPDGKAVRRLVPGMAVRAFGQVESVLVVSEGRVRLRIVQTGRSDGGEVEILSGVEPGEVVVKNPGAALRDGLAVEVAR